MEISDSNQDLRAVMIGEVILLSRQIESKLHELCAPAEAAGLHALTELLGSRLPESLQRELHFIATIRNGAAHEADFDLSEAEFSRYKNAVAHALKSIEALFPNKTADNANASGENTAAQTENTESGAEENDPEKRLAVEQELFDAIVRKLSMLGYFPISGVLFLLYILLYAMFLQGYLVLLTALYGCAVILGIKGWMSPADRGLLYIGGVTFVLVYVVTAVLGFRKPVKHLPKFVYMLPGLNVIYLPLRWLGDLQWGKFLTAAVGLAAFTAAIISACRGFFMYAVLGIAASWVISLTAALLWGKKSEE